MPAQLLDGAATAATIRGEVTTAAAAFRKETGAPLCLATVLGGDDPGSRSYVRSIGRAAERVGIAHRAVTLDAAARDEALRDTLRALNADAAVHGVIVMLPLPEGMHERTVAETLDPNKDVDGITPVNAGRLVLRQPGLVSSTPLGGMELLRRHQMSVRGLNAVVVGRSSILGRPLALMLLNESATVTVCHTQTRDLAAVCRGADLLCAATGKPGLIRGDMIKPGAIVLDFGTSPDASGKLAGDVDFEAAREVAGWITTGPGGTGPMTTAMLLSNTLAAARLQRA
jgi:methylenetetrahydrofolate dehydrogenase (NADP+)/methenyltetrahydrofolate cyclohydrolase